MDERRPSLAVILAEFLRARPNQWIDGRLIARIAGFGGWRARISDLRKPPYSMEIKNKRRTVLVDGRGVNSPHTIRLTEYRYEPAADTRPAADQGSEYQNLHQPGLWS